MSGLDCTRTCEDCRYVWVGDWLKGKKYWRCMAPGEYFGRGYIVGIGKPNPYRPAWCPLVCVPPKEAKL